MTKPTFQIKNDIYDMLESDEEPPINKKHSNIAVNKSKLSKTKRGAKTNTIAKNADKKNEGKKEPKKKIKTASEKPNDIKTKNTKIDGNQGLSSVSKTETTKPRRSSRIKGKDMPNFKLQSESSSEDDTFTPKNPRVSVMDAATAHGSDAYEPLKESKLAKTPASGINSPEGPKVAATPIGIHKSKAIDQVLSNNKIPETTNMKTTLPTPVSIEAIKGTTVSYKHPPRIANTKIKINDHTKVVNSSMANNSPVESLHDALARKPQIISWSEKGPKNQGRLVFMPNSKLNPVKASEVPPKSPTKDIETHHLPRKENVQGAVTKEEDKKDEMKDDRVRVKELNEEMTKLTAVRETVNEEIQDEEEDTILEEGDGYTITTGSQCEVEELHNEVEKDYEEEESISDKQDFSKHSEDKSMLYVDQEGNKNKEAKYEQLYSRTEIFQKQESSGIIKNLHIWDTNNNLRRFVVVADGDEDKLLPASQYFSKKSQHSQDIPKRRTVKDNGSPLPKVSSYRPIYERGLKTREPTIKTVIVSSEEPEEYNKTPSGINTGVSILPNLQEQHNPSSKNHIKKQSYIDEQWGRSIGGKIKAIHPIPFLRIPSPPPYDLDARPGNLKTSRPFKRPRLPTMDLLQEDMNKKIASKSIPWLLETSTHEVEKSHSTPRHSSKLLYLPGPKGDGQEITESKKLGMNLQEFGNSRFSKELEKKGILKSPEDIPGLIANERVSDSEFTSDSDSGESLDNDLVSDQENHGWENKLPDYHKETHAVLNKIVKQWVFYLMSSEELGERVVKDFEAQSDGLIKIYCDLHENDNTNFKKNVAAAKIEFREKCLASNDDITVINLEDGFARLEKYLESNHANMNHKIEKAFSTWTSKLR
ncbi:hypothetical protein EDC01DRAFT_654150 [Geopyxis carbonaria]|nr:hypothetical protein EDC01DRAFT_654150 [Geopyxis carbonaria]